MKKLLLSGILLLAGVTGVSAQNVVNGTVIDNEGNPIPGAKIDPPLRNWTGHSAWKRKLPPEK